MTQNEVALGGLLNPHLLQTLLLLGLTRLRRTPRHRARIMASTSSRTGCSIFQICTVFVLSAVVVVDGIVVIVVELIIVEVVAMAPVSVTKSVENEVIVVVIV